MHGASPVTLYIDMLADQMPLTVSVPLPSSIGDGAAGVAYVLFRRFIIRKDATLLARADEWLSRAFDLASFLPEARNTSSPLHGLPGLFWMRAALRAAQGRDLQCAAGVSNFIDAVRAHAGTSVDLALGDSGAALACTSLMSICPKEAHSTLRSLAQELLANLIRWIERPVAIRFDSSMPYLGAAHGWCGVLFACLLTANALEDLPPSVEARCLELAQLGERGPSGVVWPLSLRADVPKTYWDGWCHGLAGYLFLWCAAIEVLRSPAFELCAAQTAATMQRRMEALSPHLCCGLAGQAYALLRYARVSGDSQWESAARECAGRAFTDPGLALPTRAPDLMKGLLGVAMLSEELDSRGDHGFPALNGN